jgi:hypothetical protein
MMGAAMTSKERTRGTGNIAFDLADQVLSISGIGGTIRKGPRDIGSGAIPAPNRRYLIAFTMALHRLHQFRIESVYCEQR